MLIDLTWTQLKAMITDKAKLRYVDRGDFYLINYDEFETSINFEAAPSDKTDFDDNYKTSANKPAPPNIVVEKIAPYGAKTFMNGTTLKKLYARNPGIQATVAIGATNIDYTIPYPWVKIIGVEIINGEALDFVDLKVIDTYLGTYSGTPNYVMNQFSSSYNIAPGYHKHDARFDADLYQGMIVRIVYTSISAKTVGVNFIMDEVK